MDTSCNDCNKDKLECKSKENEKVKIKIYCLRFKKHTNSDNYLEKINLGYTIEIKTYCSECNVKKCRFIAKEDEEKIELE